MSKQPHKLQLTQSIISLGIIFCILYGLVYSFFNFQNKTIHKQFFVSQAQSISQNISALLPQPVFLYDQIQLKKIISKFLTNTLCLITVLDAQHKIISSAQRQHTPPQSIQLNAPVNGFKGSFFHIIIPIRAIQSNTESDILGNKLGYVYLVFQNPYQKWVLNGAAHLVIGICLFVAAFFIIHLFYHLPQKSQWSLPVLYLLSLIRKLDMLELQASEFMLQAQNFIRLFEKEFEALLHLFGERAKIQDHIKNNCHIDFPRVDMKRIDQITSAYIEIKSNIHILNAAFNEFKNIVTAHAYRYDPVIQLSSEIKKTSVNLALILSKHEEEDLLILSETIRKNSDLLNKQCQELSYDHIKTLEKIENIQFDKNGSTSQLYPDTDQIRHFWENQKLILDKSNQKLTQMNHFFQSQINKMVQLSKEINAKIKNLLKSAQNLNEK